MRVSRYERRILDEMNLAALDAPTGEVQLPPEYRLLVQEQTETAWEKLLQFPVRASAFAQRVTSQAVDLAPLIDVSHWNPIRDYSAVAGHGIESMWIKSSEGAFGWRDNMAETHMRGAADNGMSFGFYHFARPSQNQYKSARDFVAHVLELTGNEIPIIRYKADGTPVWGMALDYEITENLSGERLYQWVRGFTQEVYDLTGKWIGQYSSPYIWSLLAGDLMYFINCPLWDANWNVSAPYIMYPWSTRTQEPKYDFWQKYVLPKGSIPGIPGAIDFNVTPHLRHAPGGGDPGDPGGEPGEDPPGDGLPKVRTTAYRLNVRTQPVVSKATEIGTVSAGTVFEEVGRVGDWVQVIAYVHGGWVEDVS